MIICIIKNSEIDIYKKSVIFGNETYSNIF